MKLSKEYNSRNTPNILKTASKDKSRPILQHGHLDVERGVLESTDSYCLASIPVEIEDGDVTGMVPAEALIAYYKAIKAYKYSDLSLACGETVTLETPDGTQSWKRPEGQFPNVQQLIPEEDSRSNFRFGIDPRKLVQVADALGVETLTLSFCRRTDAEEGQDIGYHPNNMRPLITGYGDAVAIVMPVRV